MVFQVHEAWSRNREGEGAGESGTSQGMETKITQMKVLSKLWPSGTNVRAVLCSRTLFFPAAIAHSHKSMLKSAFFLITILSTDLQRTIKYENVHKLSYNQMIGDFLSNFPFFAQLCFY